MEGNIEEKKFINSANSQLNKLLSASAWSSFSIPTISVEITA